MSRRHHQGRPVQQLGPQTVQEPRDSIGPRLAEFALDGLLLAASVCLGVAVKLAIGAAAAWCYTGLCLVLLVYTLVNTRESEDAED